VSGRRWPWLVVGIAGLSSLGVGTVGTFGAGAQEGGQIVLGLTAVGASDGIGSTFGDPDAQPYPVAAGQIAHTEATLSTGPTGYALASTAWPGPLAANAGSLALLLQPNLPPETGNANYAGRTEAFSPGGPSESELPGMRAHAEGGVAEAFAGAQDVEGEPGAFTGDVQTLSRSTFEAGVLKATSSCTASDMTFGGDGAVAIGSVRTESESSTDGATGTAGGRTVVSGVTVAGQPAEVDENGVRFIDPVAAPVGEQILSQMGISMFVAQPQASDDPTRPSYRAGALVVVWDLGGSGYFYIYNICGSDTSASVRLGQAFSAPTAPTLPNRPATTPVAPSRSSTTPASPTVAAPTPTAPPAAVETPAAPDLEPIGFVRNLSIWPYILGALCCVASGFGLRRARDGALAPRSGATVCPLEGARP
jgi:hypothetical protein